MGRDLNAILGYIAQLNELDVAKVSPMAQVSELFRTRRVAKLKRRPCARTRRCHVSNVRL